MKEPESIVNILVTLQNYFARVKILYSYSCTAVFVVYQNKVVKIDGSSGNYYRFYKRHADR